MGEAVIITAIVAAVGLFFGIVILMMMMMRAFVATHGASVRASMRKEHSDNAMIQVLIEKMTADPDRMAALHRDERLIEKRYDATVTSNEVAAEKLAQPPIESLTPAKPKTFNGNPNDMIYEG